MRPTRYRIVVRGELDERYGCAFEGMRIDSADGLTVIAGTIADRSQLHGLLERIDALGLELVSLEPEQCSSRRTD